MARQAFVLNAINDTGDIAQIDGRAVWPPFYDQIAIAFRRLELPLRLQRKGFVFAIELARAGVGSPRRNGSGEFVECHVTRGKLAWIHFDADRAFHAVDVHLGNARQDVDALRDFGRAVPI